MTNATQLPEGTWELDTNSSTVTVTVKKLGFITVAGDLSINSGTIQIDESGAVTAVSVSLDAASYDSSNAKRDEHVRSNDFLSAEGFPTIGFQSTSVSKSGDGYEASGSLTIKGEQSPIVLAVSEVNFDNQKGSFSAGAKVSRKTIGVDKMPGFVIGQNLLLSVSATAIRAS